MRALPWLAVSFCLGAAARFAVPLPHALLWYFAALLCLALPIVGLRRDVPPWIAPVLALSLALVMGAWRADSWLRLPPDSVARLTDRKWVRLHGVIVSPLERRPWGAWVNVAVDRAETRRGPARVSGAVRVYLPPGDEAAHHYGQRLSVDGRVSAPDAAANPGDLPPAQYLRREGVVATMNARAVATEPGRGGNPVVAAALRSRAFLERGIAQSMRGGAESREAGLLRGLLFSDSAALPEGARDDFARSGTVHILSTSGVHVALLSGLATVLFPARRPRARKVRGAAMLVALIFFAMMTGLRPAVLRAVLMTGAVLAAPVFEREPDVWCALGLAALVLVVAAPGNLLDPGFQLSFAAALSLALWFSRADARIRAGGWIARLRRGAAVGFASSAVASVATWPLAARFFGLVSLAAPLANLVVVPLVAPAMGLGLAQGMLWPVCPSAARGLGAVNAMVLGAILGINAGVAKQPWAAMESYGMGAAGTTLILIALAVFLAARSRPELIPPRVRSAWVPLAAASAAVWIAWLSLAPRPLRVIFLDVGQGDATLIRTPGGRSVLVDAGGCEEAPRAPSARGAMSGADVGQRVVLPALKRAGVKRLDVLILTHPHEDHAGGLPPVMEALPVGLWIDGGRAHPAPGYTNALRLARERGIPRRQARAGQCVELEPGFALEILAGADTNASLNDSSIVCRLAYGGGSILLCGDIERDGEQRLVSSGIEPCTVLMAPHHGAAASCGDGLLRATRPRVAIISCGRYNPYGHPAEETLARLDAAGARVYRTDRDGAVVFSSNGGEPRFTTSRWFHE